MYGGVEKFDVSNCVQAPSECEPVEGCWEVSRELSGSWELEKRKENNGTCS